jgi:hypothetical protein
MWCAHTPAPEGNPRFKDTLASINSEIQATASRARCRTGLAVR